MLKSYKQVGGFSLVGVVLLLVVIGVAALLFAFPITAHKNSEAARETALQLEREQSAPQSGAEPAKPAELAPARPIGFGLSFALVVPAAGSDLDVALLSCHGEPSEVGRPYKGACNPYEGDTSCRVTLPVLCIRPGGTSVPSGVEADFYKGWTGGTLAATQPVMGALLSSAETASARCVAELGEGWRMAEFHDGGGGWGLQGQRGAGFGAWTRYWVQINDQPGNCWNSKP